MEARLARAAVLAAAVLSLGAQFRTPNFVVDAPSAAMARRVGLEAEKYRRELAVLWLGEALPNWSQPCPIKVRVGSGLGAGGVTSFLFDRGEVYGWRMNVQGPEDRLLDSVLPHEVTHTIFASYFRRPLPRWADEGACTTVEHASERNKQQRMLIQFLKTQRGIPFSRMFMMKEYPGDVMPLYSQGFSLATFLIDQGGRKKFLEFIRDGLEEERWTEATRQHYGYPSLAALQDSWLDWVRRGSPAQASADPPGQLASAVQDKQASESVIYRGQSEDPQPGRDTDDKAAGPAGAPPQSAVNLARAAMPPSERPRVQESEPWQPGSSSSAAPAPSGDALATPSGDAPEDSVGGWQPVARSRMPASSDGHAANRGMQRQQPAAGTAGQAPGRRKVLLEWSRAGEGSLPGRGTLR